MKNANIPEINIEEIMKRIREELATRKALSHLEADEKTSPASSEVLPIRKQGTEKGLDNLLWKYGTKYANIIKRIPIIKKYADEHYFRMLNKQTPHGFDRIPQQPQDAGSPFLAVNADYRGFLAQLGREGIRGRIKSWIFRFIGFFAVWQGQVNRAFYEEMTRARSAINDNEKLIRDVLRQEIGALRQEVEHFSALKGDRLAVDEIKHEIRDIEAHKADKRMIDEVNEKINSTFRGIDEINLEMKEILMQIGDHKLSILDQQRRLTLLLDEADKRLPEPVSARQTENMLREKDHLLDAMYVSFEDHFRGTREDIKERVKVYLPYIEKTGAGTEHSPVLDLGCGRGEWLELLRERDYAARGIDINRVMIQRCHDFGLDVMESDLVEYLRTQEANSIGAITAFHVIEHLPLSILVALLDESLRVLRPGGVAIFETPNPDNLLVGSCTFYLDPTHRNPLPSSTMKFLAEARGYCGLEILNLHPRAESCSLDETPLAQCVGSYLYGPQDYAVIGYKA